MDGTLNGHCFRATLEPDGQLSHWLRIDEDLLLASGADYGDVVAVEIMPLEHEPEPELPMDFLETLAATPAAQSVWQETTTLARVDWIHWITSSKQSATRVKRIGQACQKLASGKKRVCCFDPSGYYSKAFKAPAEADQPD